MNEKLEALAMRAVDITCALVSRHDADGRQKLLVATLANTVYHAFAQPIDTEEVQVLLRLAEAELTARG